MGVFWSRREIFRCFLHGGNETSVRFKPLQRKVLIWFAPDRGFILFIHRVVNTFDVFRIFVRHR